MGTYCPERGHVQEGKKHRAQLCCDVRTDGVGHCQNGKPILYSSLLHRVVNRHLDFPTSSPLANRVDG